MDNFKGQTTDQITNRLKQNKILVSYLPLNTTDRLQPMRTCISIKNPAKEYLEKFEDRYSEMALQQLHGKDIDDLASPKLQPINLRMLVFKEVGAKWLVQMLEYIDNNP